MRVGLVSCSPLPEPDPDEDLLLDALTEAGLSPMLLPWNVCSSDPGTFELCVLRSCWDYHFVPGRFVEWLTDAAARTRLLNPLPVVRWNLHKSYLRELEAAGVPVVPTAWVGRGDPPDLAGVMEDRGWDEVVVKPAIGAGSYQTRRFDIDAAGDAGGVFLASLMDRGEAMIQPFMASVMTAGERSLVWIDGEFTHQIVKQPRYHGQDEQVSGASAPSGTDLRIATQALSCVAEPLLYARVDLIEDQDGAAVVSELELIEPSLFLLQHRPALDRFVAAIARYA
jgi:hypothetical protein